ncbi:MAG: alpha-1,4-glucan--maltose-1-phosphate maltosyltransferase [Pseudomonadota bacterium]
MPGLDSLQALASERIAIEAVSIEVDGGRFPSKAVAGHPFRITADIFGDGHEGICAAVRFGKSGSDEAQEVPLTPEINDLWSGEITLDENAFYDVTILAWRDLYGTWAHDVAKKHAAGQDISLELIEARQLIETAIDPSNPASAEDKSALRALLGQDEASGSADARLSVLTSPTTLATMRRAAPRANLTAYKTLKVFADRERAAFSAWYELMPRSQSGDVNRHGTFDDVIARLPYVRDLGFDVLYFPPIHPIGRTNRKGRNNTLTPGPDDPGSPYAIGASEGGHDAIHPELGDFESFKRLVDAAHAHGLEIALDFAIQCSPDHPWIKEHPEWFDWRPDGSIKFAENPPKKYEDIVNVHFYRGALPDLWYALRDIVLFWIGHGVKIFRVDNPHTKPFPFWEWMIGEIRAEYPETIFLAEAFTRPKLMKRLAKVGFNQSYSYFTWRNDRWGLTEYLTELTQEPCREYMRPNFFVNTPDINPHYLQTSGRPGFQIRLCLAASLGGNYGVYNGFEICEAAPFPGKEEYLDSEKYEIRAWDMDQPGHIQDDIRLMNRLRQQHPALRDFLNVGFYQTSNDQILSYSKKTRDLSDFLLFHVNLDPHNTQFLSFEVPLWEFGLPDDAGILVRDAIHGNTFTWYGKPQTLELNPHTRPYTIWQLFAPGTGPS